MNSRSIRVARATRSRRSAGQSLVETAIALPVLIALVLGVTDIGRGFYFKEAVTNAARQAMRLAVSSSQHAAADTVCASGGTATTNIPSAGGPLATIANTAALESSANGTAAGSVISGATLTVTWHCQGGVAISNSTNPSFTDPADARSAAVRVRLDYTMGLVTPFVSGLLSQTALTIRSDLLGRAEY